MQIDMDAARLILRRRRRLLMILCLILCFISHATSLMPSDRCPNYDISRGCQSEQKCNEDFRFWYGNDHVGYGFCDYDAEGNYDCYFCHEPPPPTPPPSEEQLEENSVEEEAQEMDDLQKDDGGTDGN